MANTFNIETPLYQQVYSSSAHCMYVCSVSGDEFKICANIFDKHTACEHEIDYPCQFSNLHIWISLLLVKKCGF
jgi:hypothetical protein